MASQPPALLQGPHGPQRGQSQPLAQLQQIVRGADDAPFRLHIFEAL